MRNWFIAILLLGVLTAPGWSEGAVAPPAPPPGKTAAPAEVKPSTTATTPAETKLGKETAAQIEKDQKLVADEKQIARLNALAAEIAPVTQRPDVVYRCKILDTPALNAMVIPGGTIYFTKGILAAFESEHELAAVMAHEIAHNSLNHMKRMLERESNASIAQVIALVAALSLSRGEGAPTEQLILASQLIKQALLNGYSQELEVEADLNGVEYLQKLGRYNPIGLYSVILGFRQMEAHRPFVDLGYLKTHPYADERKVLLEQHYAKHGIKLNLWPVVNFLATLVPPSADKAGHTIRLGDVDIIALQAADGAEEAKARATDAVAAINRRLQRDYIQQLDVSGSIHDGSALLQLRGITVLTLTAADAAQAKMTLEALCALVVQNVKAAFWQESVKRS
jgi:hypothetical protein